MRRDAGVLGGESPGRAAAEDAAGEPDGRGTAAAPLPLWFERGLVVAAAAVVSFGASGLLLAVLGHYRMLWAFLLGGLGTAAAGLVGWPRRRPAPAPRRSVMLPAVGMCLVAGAFAAWNGLHAGHHVAIGRDPGVYTVTGKWLATHGDLQVPTGPDWSAKDPHLVVETLGVYAEDNRRLEFQFNHLTPVLLAEAGNLGGDALMFRVPALLGGLALCAVYAVGCLLVRRPWLVLAAVGALALSLPQLNASRDTYSEPSVEFLLWSGLWLVLLALERRRTGPALLAGAALGGMMLSRIDGLEYLVPLPALGALAWLCAGSAGGRRHLARVCLLMLAGAAPMAVLGLVDVVDHAGRYYADLHSQVRGLQAAFGLSVIAGAVLLLGGRPAASRLSGLTAWVGARRAAIGTAAAAVAGAGLLAAWALRPAVQHPHATPIPLVGGLQNAAGIPADPARSYAENTVTWLVWYLGPVAVALGILGAALLVARTCRRPEPAGTLVLAVAGLATAASLWNPAIVPDQIWAMRRFVPATLPLVVLLAAVALDAVAVAAARVPASPGLARAVLASGAAGLLVFPLGVTAPQRGFQPQAGYLTVVEAACRITGPQAAILFVPDDPLGIMLPPAVRSWCDVPVAVSAGAISAQRLREVAAAWQAEGRSLWLLGSAPEAVAGPAPGVSPVFVASATSSRELETTINRPPQYFSVGTLTVYAAQVSP